MKENNSALSNGGQKKIESSLQESGEIPKNSGKETALETPLEKRTARSVRPSQDVYQAKKGPTVEELELGSASPANSGKWLKKTSISTEKAEQNLALASGDQLSVGDNQMAASMNEKKLKAPASIVSSQLGICDEVSAGKNQIAPVKSDKMSVAPLTQAPSKSDKHMERSSAITGNEKKFEGEAEPVSKAPNKKMSAGSSKATKTRSLIPDPGVLDQNVLPEQVQKKKSTLSSDLQTAATYANGSPVLNKNALQKQNGDPKELTSKPQPPASSSQEAARKKGQTNATVKTIKKQPSLNLEEKLTVSEIEAGLPSSQAPQPNNHASQGSATRKKSVPYAERNKASDRPPQPPQKLHLPGTATSCNDPNIGIKSWNGAIDNRLSATQASSQVPEYRAAKMASPAQLTSQALLEQQNSTSQRPTEKDGFSASATRNQAPQIYGSLYQNQADFLSVGSGFPMHAPSSYTSGAAFQPTEPQGIFPLHSSFASLVIQELPVPEELQSWCSEAPEELAEVLAKVKRKTQVQSLSLEENPSRLGGKVIRIGAQTKNLCSTTEMILNMHFKQQLQLEKHAQRVQLVQAELTSYQQEYARGLIIEFKLAEPLIGLAIGKEGSHIKKVREETGVTRIDFEDAVDGYATVQIQGKTTDAVMAAKEMMDLKEEEFPLSEEQFAYFDAQRITMASIRESSGAKVVNLRNGNGSILLIGSQSSLANAKLLLETQLEYLHKHFELRESEKMIRSKLRALQVSSGGRGQGRNREGSSQDGNSVSTRGSNRTNQRRNNNNSNGERFQNQPGRGSRQNRGGGGGRQQRRGQYESAESNEAQPTEKIPLNHYITNPSGRESGAESSRRRRSDSSEFDHDQYQEKLSNSQRQSWGMEAEQKSSSVYGYTQYPANNSVRSRERLVDAPSGNRAHSNYVKEFDKKEQVQTSNRRGPTLREYSGK